MKIKLLTIAFCLTGILAQNIQAQTTSEPISKEEAIEFWTAFNKLCKEKDTVNIARFVTDTIIQEKIDENLATSKHYYTLQDAKKDFVSGYSAYYNFTVIMPYWLVFMPQVELDKPVVTEDNDEFGFQVDNKNPNEYIYWFRSSNRRLTCLETYYFKKINGNINYYKKTVICY